MFYDYKGKKYLLNLIDTPVRQSHQRVIGLGIAGYHFF